MLTSWLEIPKDSDFSLQNIPFGICRIHNRDTCVTRIGDTIIDLHTLQEAGVFDHIIGFNENSFSYTTLNNFLGEDHDYEVWSHVRQQLITIFSSDTNDVRVLSDSQLQKAALHPLTTDTKDNYEMQLPVSIGDYTDFYSSKEHATNVGIMFRGKENALQPNWLHLPVGYHGRASTVFVSGTNIRRPYGQLQIDNNDPKKGSILGPTKLLDFELEVAFFVGGGPSDTNGKPLSIEQAKKRVFGYVLMNDWSARDIQKFEYVPLGPFTSKNFATSISPWIIPTDALQPYISETSVRKQDNPIPLQYLQDPEYSSYDVQLSVAIQSPTMKQPYTVCHSNFKNLYWNAVQQLVHHSVTGCRMKPGDLLGSGTISGTNSNSFGSLLELSWKGTREVQLGEKDDDDDIETRKFLKDGDTVIMKGCCFKEGAGRVGFGECVGKVLPSMVTSNEEEEKEATRKNSKSSRSMYQNFKIYSYDKSASSWSVRIALHSKNIPYEIITVTNDNRGEVLSRFPSLVGEEVSVLECIDTAATTTATTNHKYITQTTAIIEFLDEAFPNTKSLIPKQCHNNNINDKIIINEIIQIIYTHIQPFIHQVNNNNPSINEGKTAPITSNCNNKEIIQKGLKAISLLIHNNKTNRGGPYCIGSFAPTIVDICLIPQLHYIKQNYGINVDLESPILSTIENICLKHPWFSGSKA